MAPGDKLQGRRIPIEMKAGTEHPEFPRLEQPGDYCGPIKGWTGDLPAVFFLKPNARDDDAPQGARSVQHVCSPPHTFTAEADGTLTIAPSISDRKRDQKPETPGDGWHGFLLDGVWRQV